MPESFAALALRLRQDAAARAAFECPVLMWVNHPAASGQHWEKTRGPNPPAASSDSSPLIFRVEKAAKAQNAFAFGITLGRVDNNDLVLDDDSVSRFHAFLRYEERTCTWFLTDAESKNGSWVEEQKLTPNVGVALADEAKVRIGDAQLTFLMPVTLLKLVDRA